MKQKQFPLFDHIDDHADQWDDLLCKIETTRPRDLLIILTKKGITTSDEERRHWDEAYGYNEEGGRYHWIPFDEYIHQERPQYRDIVLRVRDGTAKDYIEAKEQTTKEGRKNLRMLVRQLRSRLGNTMS